MNHADRQDRDRWIASGLPDAVVTIMFRDGTLPPPHARALVRLVAHHRRDHRVPPVGTSGPRRRVRCVPRSAWPAPPTSRSSRRGQGSMPPRSSARSTVASPLANSLRRGPEPTPTSPRRPSSPGCCRATSNPPRHSDTFVPAGLRGDRVRRRSGHQGEEGAGLDRRAVCRRRPRRAGRRPGSRRRARRRGPRSLRIPRWLA